MQTGAGYNFKHKVSVSLLEPTFKQKHVESMRANNADEECFLF